MGNVGNERRPSPRAKRPSGTLIRYSQCQLATDRIADAAVGPDDLAILGLGSERWVGRLNADAQGFFGRQHMAGSEQAEGQGGDKRVFLHDWVSQVIVGLASVKK